MQARVRGERSYWCDQPWKRVGLGWLELRAAALELTRSKVFATQRPLLSSKPPYALGAGVSRSQSQASKAPTASYLCSDSVIQASHRFFRNPSVSQSQSQSQRKQNGNIVSIDYMLGSPSSGRAPADRRHGVKWSHASFPSCPPAPLMKRKLTTEILC